LAGLSSREAPPSKGGGIAHALYHATRTAIGKALLEYMVASMEGDPISGVPFDMVAPPHVKRYARRADTETHGDTVWRET
jgi:hypothetical protein